MAQCGRRARNVRTLQAGDSAAGYCGRATSAESGGGDARAESTRNAYCAGSGAFENTHRRCPASSPRFGIFQPYAYARRVGWAGSTMGGGISRNLDRARERANHLSSDEEDDDEHFLMPKMWINRSLHKLANGEFMEPYQTQQELRKCCRWCHDCHDDALSLLCLCRRYAACYSALACSLSTAAGQMPCVARVFKNGWPGCESMGTEAVFAKHLMTCLRIRMNAATAST